MEEAPCPSFLFPAHPKGAVALITRATNTHPSLRETSTGQYLLAKTTSLQLTKPRLSKLFKGHSTALAFDTPMLGAQTTKEEVKDLLTPLEGKASKELGY